MAGISKEEFVRDFSRAVSSHSAAVFAGAGLSRSSGFVDWKELLREIAADLKLNIDKESDLVGLAQFHLNERQNRSRLNEKLIDEFTKDATPTENHRILARLPLVSFWTTNYDTLIEDSIRAAGRSADVKITQANLAQTRPGRDVIVYKMHGDISQPQDAILTKDDYECYESTHRLFVENLQGDLVSTTFLFLGFSFTDPNIDYVLSRVRVLLGTNQRTHYCIMRQPKPPKKGGQSRAEYDYEKRRLELRIDDLKRFAIQTVLVDEFEEITDLLRAISKMAHRRNVFVSASARESGAFGATRLNNLSRRIGRELIDRDYNLVSGFGRGLGDQVILGALDGIYQTHQGNDSNRTIIRPFPRTKVGHGDQASTDTRHREDLISQSGAAIFLCGNRDYNGTVGNSKGVVEEFRIAKALGRYPVPVGCTGYAAEEVWKEVLRDADSLFPMRGVKTALQTLGNRAKSDDDLIAAIFKILDRVTIG
ncbi:MAG: SIR2 family protein [Candidatus Kapaibacterium sp.]